MSQFTNDIKGLLSFLHLSSLLDSWGKGSYHISFCSSVVILGKSIRWTEYGQTSARGWAEWVEWLWGLHLLLRGESHRYDHEGERQRMFKE